MRVNGPGVIREHQRLTLSCLVDAYPPVESFQWLKNNELLPSSNRSHSQLIIERVSKDDAAVYTCEAKNTLKSSNGSLISRVTRAETRVLVECTCSDRFVSSFLSTTHSRLDAPRVRPINRIIAVDPFVSSSIDLQCQIDSYPESTVEWIHRNEIISQSNKKVSSIRQNGSSAVLTLRTLQSNSDYGSYRCHARNHLGNDSAMIDVRSKGSAISRRFDIDRDDLLCFQIDPKHQRI